MYIGCLQDITQLSGMHTSSPSLCTQAAYKISLNSQECTHPVLPYVHRLPTRYHSTLQNAHIQSCLMYIGCLQDITQLSGMHTSSPAFCAQAAYKISLNSLERTHPVLPYVHRLPTRYHSTLQSAHIQSCLMYIGCLQDITQLSGMHTSSPALCTQVAYKISLNSLERTHPVLPYVHRLPTRYHSTLRNAHIQSCLMYIGCLQDITQLSGMHTSSPALCTQAAYKISLNSLERTYPVLPYVHRLPTRYHSTLRNAHIQPCLLYVRCLQYITQLSRTHTSSPALRTQVAYKISLNSLERTHPALPSVCRLPARYHSTLQNAHIQPCLLQVGCLQDITQLSRTQTSSPALYTQVAYKISLNSLERTHPVLPYVHRLPTRYHSTLQNAHIQPCLLYVGCLQDITQLSRMHTSSPAFCRQVAYKISLNSLEHRHPALPYIHRLPTRYHSTLQNTDIQPCLIYIGCLQDITQLFRTHTSSPAFCMQAACKISLNSLECTHPALPSVGRLPTRYHLTLQNTDIQPCLIYIGCLQDITQLSRTQTSSPALYTQVAYKISLNSLERTHPALPYIHRLPTRYHSTLQNTDIQPCLIYIGCLQDFTQLSKTQTSSPALYTQVAYKISLNSLEHRHPALPYIHRLPTRYHSTLQNAHIQSCLMYIGCLQDITQLSRTQTSSPALYTQVAYKISLNSLEHRHPALPYIHRLPTRYHSTLQNAHIQSCLMYIGCLQDITQLSRTQTSSPALYTQVAYKISLNSLEHRHPVLPYVHRLPTRYHSTLRNAHIQSCLMYIGCLQDITQLSRAHTSSPALCTQAAYKISLNSQECTHPVLPYVHRLPTRYHSTLRNAHIQPCLLYVRCLQYITQLSRTHTSSPALCTQVAYKISLNSLERTHPALPSVCRLPARYHSTLQNAHIQPCLLQVGCLQDITQLSRTQTSSPALYTQVAYKISLNSLERTHPVLPYVHRLPTRYHSTLQNAHIQPCLLYVGCLQDITQLSRMHTSSPAFCRQVAYKISLNSLEHRHPALPYIHRLPTRYHSTLQNAHIQPCLLYVGCLQDITQLSRMHTSSPAFCRQVAYKISLNSLEHRHPALPYIHRLPTRYHSTLQNTDIQPCLIYIGCLQDITQLSRTHTSSPALYTQVAYKISLNSLEHRHPALPYIHRLPTRFHSTLQNTDIQPCLIYIGCLQDITQLSRTQTSSPALYTQVAYKISLNSLERTHPVLPYVHRLPTRYHSTLQNTDIQPCLIYIGCLQDITQLSRTQTSSPALYTQVAYKISLNSLERTHPLLPYVHRLPTRYHSTLQNTDIQPCLIYIGCLQDITQLSRTQTSSPALYTQVAYKISLNSLECTHPALPSVRRLPTRYHSTLQNAHIQSCLMYIGCLQDITQLSRTQTSSPALYTQVAYKISLNSLERTHPVLPYVHRLPTRYHSTLQNAHIQPCLLCVGCLQDITQLSRTHTSSPALCTQVAYKISLNSLERTHPALPSVRRLPTRYHSTLRNAHIQSCLMYIGCLQDITQLSGMHTSSPALCTQAAYKISLNSLECTHPALPSVRRLPTRYHSTLRNAHIQSCLMYIGCLQDITQLSRTHTSSPALCTQVAYKISLNSLERTHPALPSVHRLPTRYHSTLQSAHIQSCLMYIGCLQDITQLSRAHTSSPALCTQVAYKISLNSKECTHPVLPYIHRLPTRYHSTLRNAHIQSCLIYIGCLQDITQLSRTHTSSPAFCTQVAYKISLNSLERTHPALPYVHRLPTRYHSTLRNAHIQSCLMYIGCLQDITQLSRMHTSSPAFCAQVAYKISLNSQECTHPVLPYVHRLPTRYHSTLQNAHIQSCLMYIGCLQDITQLSRTHTSSPAFCTQVAYKISLNSLERTHPVLPYVHRLPTRYHSTLQSAHIQPCLMYIGCLQDITQLSGMHTSSPALYTQVAYKISLNSQECTHPVLPYIHRLPTRYHSTLQNAHIQPCLLYIGCLQDITQLSRAHTSSPALCTQVAYKISLNSQECTHPVLPNVHRLPTRYHSTLRNAHIQPCLLYVGGLQDITQLSRTHTSSPAFCTQIAYQISLNSLECTHPVLPSVGRLPTRYHSTLQNAHIQPCLLYIGCLQDITQLSRTHTSSPAFCRQVAYKISLNSLERTHPALPSVHRLPTRYHSTLQNAHIQPCLLYVGCLQDITQLSRMYTSSPAFCMQAACKISLNSLECTHPALPSEHRLPTRYHSTLQNAHIQPCLLYIGCLQDITQLSRTHTSSPAFCMQAACKISLNSLERTHPALPSVHRLPTRYHSTLQNAHIQPCLLYVGCLQDITQLSRTHTSSLAFCMQAACKISLNSRTHTSSPAFCMQAACKISHNSLERTHPALPSVHRLPTRYHSTLQNAHIQPCLLYVGCLQDITQLSRMHTSSPAFCMQAACKISLNSLERTHPALPSVRRLPTRYHSTLQNAHIQPCLLYVGCLQDITQLSRMHTSSPAF